MKPPQSFAVVAGVICAAVAVESCSHEHCDINASMNIVHDAYREKSPSYIVVQKFEAAAHGFDICAIQTPDVTEHVQYTWWKGYALISAATVRAAMGDWDKATSEFEDGLNAEKSAIHDPEAPAALRDYPISRIEAVLPYIQSHDRNGFIKSMIDMNRAAPNNSEP